MSLITYLNPNAITEGSIDGISLKDGAISSSKISAISKSITWSELKTMRDAGELIPGMQYRITDYQCTTTQEGTKAAGQVFDIIVTADDENTLNEVARAIQHDGDEYFANSDLNAWKIWYCLDNDTNRFAWADGTNGKGVIYRMIDEFNNDCPYDFKNIQFKHPLKPSTYPYYYYTFASDNVEDNTDCSLDIANSCYSNTIMEYITECKRSLNKILFIGSTCYCNSFGPNSFSNFLGYKCYCNSFNSKCDHNSLYYNCVYNVFADGCNGNRLGKYCAYNMFGPCCVSNHISDHGYKNSFGAICRHNQLGYACKQNNFGNGCESNYLQEYSESNSFGSGCLQVYFDNSYYRNNHFGDGCQYIYFKGTETASKENQIQNYNFSQGLQGNYMFSLSIVGLRNRPYETKVENKSNGEVKTYCAADIADLFYDGNDNSYYYSASFIGEI